MGLLNTFWERNRPPTPPSVPAAEFARVREELDNLRAFVHGPGVVDRWEMTYGHDDSQFGPAEYGDYIATSNGVYACAIKRAKALAKLPPRLYKLSGKDKKTEVVAGPLYDLLHKVNPFWTLKRLKMMMELSLCLWGETFLFLERGMSGKQPPKEIWWARSDRVRVIPDPVNYIKGYVYSPVNGEEDIYFGPDEVIWIAYPNPLDEFSGLAPMAAARLAADYARAAMISNKRVFEQGMNLGGVITPPPGDDLTADQARQVEEGFDRRFRGADKAHRWAVLRRDYKVTPITAMTAMEAQYLEGMKWSLEDICRAFEVPLDLLGGQRTYENYGNAMRGFWSDTILPEADFIADELTEKLLPMFPGVADILEFDASDIEVLQDDENDDWQRASDQITKGAITINEWRIEKGLPLVSWGDLPMGVSPAAPEGGSEGDGAEKPQRDILGYHIAEGVVTRNEARASLGLASVDDALSEKLREATSVLNVLMLAGQAGVDPAALLTWLGVDLPLAPKPAPMLPPPAEQPPEAMDGAMGEDMPEVGEEAPRGFTGRFTLVNTLVQPVRAYGDEEHARLWGRAIRRAEKHEETLGNAVGALFERQLASVIARLKGRSARKAEDVADDPFDLAQWVKTFRVELRPIITAIVRDTGADALDDLGKPAVGIAFDLNDQRVRRMIERRAQRFAREVNDTTWAALKASLSEGLGAGETTAQLTDRVQATMQTRTRAASNVIARTEVHGATHESMVEAWKQSGVVKGKTWLAALDDRTRESHTAAHGQTVGMDENFTVGGSEGPAPGQMGSADEDVNCRCSMTAVLD